MPTEMFKISSPFSTINFTDKMTTATRLKIKRFIYNTSSPSNYYMTVKLSGWSQSHYFNSNENVNIFILPRTTLSETDYMNVFDNTWDVIFTDPRNIGSHNLECLINSNVATSTTDIRSDNPLYIEFEYS